MAKVTIMYWKEIPVQVKAQDESGQASQPLDPRFQEGVDSVSVFDGSSGADEYLDAWDWGQPSEAEGTAEEAAAAVADRFNKGFPKDFARRIQRLHTSGERDPRPGAIDHWADNGTD